MQRSLVGRRAEAYVADLLEFRGWRLLARNLRTPYGEIDILALDPGDELVVVEVKARHPLSWSQEEETLRPHQRRRLARALQWIEERHLWRGPSRIDLAAVTALEGRPRSCRWYAGVDPES